MSTRLTLPARRNHITQKVKVASQPEQGGHDSLTNRPAVYVTEHCTGKRREGQSVKGMGASWRGVLGLAKLRQGPISEGAQVP